MPFTKQVRKDSERLVEENLTQQHPDLRMALDEDRDMPEVSMAEVAQVLQECLG